MAETETELEYRLSAEQRELWRSSLPKLRGTQASLADKLTQVAKGKRESWKNVVSGFLKGEAGALRSVFSHAARTRIVADALGLGDNDLRLRLRAAREHDREDRHGWRIPGFEDLGVFPILEALYPCPRGRGSAHSSMKMPDWSLEALVEISLAEPAKGGRIVAIIDELALDAKPALRWLEARLKRDERPVIDWRDPSLCAGSLVLQPDLDALSDTERDSLLSRVRAADATVFVTTTIDDPGTNWPTDVIVYQPGRGWLFWAARYLEHLERLLSRNGFSVDFSALQHWLEDDPKSAWAVERAHSLGVVARHVFDGKSLSFASKDLLDHSIERARAWLEHRGLRAEAKLLEICGRRALSLMAVDMCRRGELQASHEAIARRFVDAAVGIAGPKEWKQVAVSGMIGVVTELVACGLIREHRGLLSTAQHHLAVVSLGHYLADHLDDDELIVRAATTPRWQGAFLAAAEALADPSPIIEVLMRRSIGVRHVAVPALTMVLECDARPSNVEAFAEAHLHALRWWASHPPPPAEHPRTLFFRRMRRQSAVPTSTFQLGGRSALVALGQASHRHRDVLPSNWTPSTLLELEPDPVQVALGHGLLDNDQALAALLIGAPFQLTTFHDPQPWRARMGVDDPREPISLGLTHDDYALWWRTVAVPRLREEAESDARLIGAKPGFSVGVAMRQNKRGTQIWSEALTRVLAAGVDGGRQAFVNAVACLVEFDGRHNFEAIQSLWTGIEPQTQADLRREVRSRIAHVHWNLSDDMAAWVMREFFDSDSLYQLWLTWQCEERVRWEPLLRAGLYPSAILDWALSGEVNLIEFDWQDERDPIDEVFHALLAMDDPEFLVEMEVRAPHRWRQLVRDHLRKYDRLQVDRARLVALQHWSSEPYWRAALARWIDPGAGDPRAWLNLAESETTELGRLMRLVQADLSAQDDNPWKHTLRVLDRLCEMFESPLDHYDRDRLATNTPVDAITEDVARWLLRDPIAEILVLLGNGLVRENPPKHRATIIQRVFERPHLRACILGGVCAPWWSVAREILGDAYVVGVVRAGHDDHEQASLVRLQFMGLPRSSLIALTGDDRLGLAAATVLGQRIADGVLEPLGIDEVATLLADQRLDPASDAVRALISSYLDTGPKNIERLAGLIAQRLEPGARSMWWRNIANEVKDPATLAVLLDAWLVGQG